MALIAGLSTLTPGVTPVLELPLSNLWGTAVGFMAIFIIFIAAIGASSRSLAIASAGGYVMFVHFAVVTSHPFLEPTMYVSLATISLGISFKIWRAEIGGDDL